MSASILLACDAHGCQVAWSSQAHTIHDARKAARVLGWLTGVHGWRLDPPTDGRVRRDYCPEHRAAAVRGRTPHP